MQKDKVFVQRMISDCFFHILFLIYIKLLIITRKTEIKLENSVDKKNTIQHTCHTSKRSHNRQQIFVLLHPLFSPVTLVKRCPHSRFVLTQVEKGNGTVQFLLPKVKTNLLEFSE